MKVCTKKTDYDHVYYKYAEGEDGLFYLVTPPSIATVTGYTEESMIADGFTLETIS